MLLDAGVDLGKILAALAPIQPGLPSVLRILLVLFRDVDVFFAIICVLLSSIMPGGGSRGAAVASVAVGRYQHKSAFGIEFRDGQKDGLLLDVTSVFWLVVGRFHDGAAMLPG